MSDPAAGIREIGARLAQLLEEERAGGALDREGRWLARKESLGLELESWLAGFDPSTLSEEGLKDLGELLSRLKVDTAVSSKLTKTRLNLAGLAGWVKTPPRPAATYSAG